MSKKLKFPFSIFFLLSVSKIPTFGSFGFCLEWEKMGSHVVFEKREMKERMKRKGGEVEETWRDNKCILMWNFDFTLLNIEELPTWALSPFLV